jgi:hypothetical protein
VNAATAGGQYSLSAFFRYVASTVEELNGVYVSDHFSFGANAPACLVKVAVDVDAFAGDGRSQVACSTVRVCGAHARRRLEERHLGAWTAAVLL